MQCKDLSYVPDGSPFAIRDTKDMTAKKLLVYFWETFDALEDLLYNTETVQAIYMILQTSAVQKVPEKAREILEGLPWEVCSCFYKFLLECPHVHVTID